MHIVFNECYLDYISRGQDKTHTSWLLKAEPKEYLFGGKVGNLNRLIFFDVIPDFLNIKSHNSLELAMDFELFFNAQIDGKVLSYKHNSNGIPQLLTKNIKVEFPYANSPIIETKIKLAKTPNALLNQEWIGNCNKVGGDPIWVQEVEEMICPTCNQKMSFILQLDSGIPDGNLQNSNEIMFGNDGICYAFWCDIDNISSYIWQCT